MREPLSRITGRQYDIPAFARHLKEFASEKRGYALVKSGTPGRTFYRFENPLLQPFTILHGLEKGLITEDQLVKRGQNGGTSADEHLDVFDETNDDGDD